MRETRTRLLTSTAFVLAALTFGCAPPPPDDAGAIPEITKEVIDERINDARVYEVTPEIGPGEPIAWSFDFDEPKEIVIIDKRQQGTQATIILDIKTQSSPRARIMRKLAGQIRTEWKLETGWALRRWEIVSTENISMRYKDIPKAEPSNPN